MSIRLGASIAVIVLVTSACTSGTAPASALADQQTDTPRPSFPSPPPVPDGSLSPSVAAALDELLSSVVAGGLDEDALEAVADSSDARLGWVLSDLLRLLQGTGAQDRLSDAFARLTGVDPTADPAYRRSPWKHITDLLIAWDLPAPPNYREAKGRIFLALEPRWQPFFADADAEIDWRLLSWGGVFIDDRPLGDQAPCPRGCIPALDDPALVSVDEGSWYPDDRVVFGIEVDGDIVALPRNVMEVHEMVNTTIGGRRVGIPYCTLCGSAQAYFTDSVPEGVEVPVLRTSGLLVRSNKVMYDLVTGSVFDTFTGRALSGPLQDARVALEQITVVVSRWGDWKAAHPTTRIVARDGGIGRRYPDDPLGGRDDAGPIFPIGDADPRLPVHAQVVGVVPPGGEPVAFPVDHARTALAEGRSVALGDVELVADGSGFRARTSNGDELPAHQSFWFAWSQFHPTTAVWTPLAR